MYSTWTNNTTADFSMDDLDKIIKNEIRSKLPKYRLVITDWTEPSKHRPRSFKKNRVRRKWFRNPKNQIPIQPFLLSIPSPNDLGLNEKGEWDIIIHESDLPVLMHELGEDRCKVDMLFLNASKRKHLPHPTTKLNERE